MSQPQVDVTILDSVIHKQGHHAAAATSGSVAVSKQTYPPQQTSNSSQSPTLENSNGTYEDVYRTGNFGIRIGRVNLTRGKRWLMAHAACALFMFVFTLIATVLLKHFTVAVFKNFVLGYSWAASLLGVSSAALGAYFFLRLPMLSHPYAVLMTFRFLAVFNWIANLAFGWLFTILIALADKEKFVGLSDTGIGFLKAVCVGITIIMILEMVISFAFVFAWWGFCPAFPDLCKCCAESCVYDQGQEIAPGVLDPPSSLKIFRAAQVLAPLSNLS